MLSLLSLFDKPNDSSFVLVSDKGGESFFFSLTTPSFHRLPDSEDIEVFLWDFKKGVLELQFDDRVVVLKLTNDADNDGFFAFNEFISMNNEPKVGFQRARSLSVYKQTVPLEKFIDDQSQQKRITPRSILLLAVSVLTVIGLFKIGVI